MTEKKSEPAQQQEIRVIDRRSFTSDGARRSPDSQPREESSAPAAVAPSAEETGGEPASGGGEAVASPHFQSLVLNLARQAAAHLGAGPSPISGQVEVDLEAAQQMIDLLNALHLKTRGNLTQDEKEMIEGLIGDLQMQFVTVRSKDPNKS
jgi:hypothetical protein